MNKTFKKVVSIGSAALLTVFSLVMPAAAAVADQGNTEADIAFSSGILELPLVPSFNFGTHTISTADQFYAGTITDKIAVSDARGSEAGWELSASMAAFSNDGGTTLTLDGAKIKIIPGAAYTTTGSGVLPSTVTPLVELISGAPAYISITRAAVGEGSGLMENVIASSELTVYGGTALVGGHTAVIDWTLGDTP